MAVTKNDIGKAIVTQFKESAAAGTLGLEGFNFIREDSGLVVFEFEDGTKFRAIIDQIWG